MKKEDIARLGDEGVPIYGDFGFRGDCPTESLEQITFFARLRREYPSSYGLIAIHQRNEGLRTKGQIAAISKHKAEGMTTGASDIIIPAKVSFVCEMKRADHTKSQFEDGQIEYLLAAQKAGAFVCVALGCNAAWQAFLEWKEEVM